MYVKKKTIERKKTIHEEYHWGHTRAKLKEKMAHSFKTDPVSENEDIEGQRTNEHERPLEHFQTLREKEGHSTSARLGRSDLFICCKSSKREAGKRTMQSCNKFSAIKRHYLAPPWGYFHHFSLR